eukprot:945494-Amphidinium_carterae.1
MLRKGGFPIFHLLSLPSIPRESTGLVWSVLSETLLGTTSIHSELLSLRTLCPCLSLCRLQLGLLLADPPPTFSYR